MPLNRMPLPARGLSLVELMIGITVGLFVVAGATFMLTNQLQDNRRLMLETQVQQDLRAAADLVARELRRAGYSPLAHNAAWYPGTPGVMPSAYTAIDASDTEVRFRYGVDNDNTVAANEQFGFRLDGGVIRFLLNGAWQPLTDPGTMNVTAFAIAEALETIDLSHLCPRPLGPATPPPTQTVREYTVSIGAAAARDATVQRSLRVTVRPRNDIFTGACP